MMDKDACSLFEGILGMNRSVSSDFEDKLVVVGLLVDAEVLYDVFDILYGRIDGVDGEDVDIIVSYFLLFGWHPSATLIDCQHDSETCIGIQMAYHLIGIKHLEAGQGLAYISGRKYFCSRDGDGDFFVFVVLDNLAQVYLLEVEDDVGDIFFDTGDGVKLVFNAVDAYRRNGEALQGREKHTPQRVAHSDAIAGFQGFKLEFAVEVVCFKHQDFVGLLEL